MNIQQFYEKSALMSLNASIISLVPPFFFIIYGIIVLPNKQYIVFLIPYLLYSLFFYQNYLIHAMRANNVSISYTNTGNLPKLFDDNEVMITFLPAHSLRMVIFHKEGHQVGEIRDLYNSIFRWLLPDFLDKLMNKKYGLYNELNQLIAIFYLKKNGIEINLLDGESFFIKKLHQEGKKIMYTDEESALNVKHSKLFTDSQIFKDEHIICRFRRGWLPLDWGKRFIDPNTPVLSFEYSLKNKEKIMIFAILSDFLRYTDH